MDPNSPGFKPFTPTRGLNPDSRVCDLIGADMGIWDLEALRANFDDNEVTHIGSVPLSNSLHEDKWIWHFEKDGEFSVKTAYHLLGDLRRVSKSGPSSKVRQKVWKNLWKVLVNERIKKFTWRLAKDILPTKANLSKKGIAFDVSCPFCHLHPENSLHLFLQCDFSKRVFLSLHWVCVFLLIVMC